MNVITLPKTPEKKQQELPAQQNRKVLVRAEYKEISQGGANNREIDLIYGFRSSYGLNIPFNIWASLDSCYTTSPKYCKVDYSRGWEPNIHDHMLLEKIVIIYRKNKKEKEKL